MPVSMPTIQHEHEISFNELSDKITAHVERHKVAYSFGAGLLVAGIAIHIFSKQNVVIIIPDRSKNMEYDRRSIFLSERIPHV
jgi:non-homologous end joining protein Ku